MNVEELFDELGIKYLSEGHHHCRTGWLQLQHCPFCDSTNYHLGWNLAGSYFVCWRCGGHSAWSVLEKLGLARSRIKEVLGSLGPERTRNSEISKISRLIEPKKRGPLLKVHKTYLRARGFDPDEITRLWNIEGIGIHPSLAWRIYIPVTYHAVRVSWTTRAIGDRVTQRYVSASSEQESIPHKHLAYGLDFVRHSVVICEGPTDAWAIGPGAVALFGMAFTPAQVKLLIEIPNRFICFDSSDEAQVKARQLADQLSCFAGNTENLIIDAKDPGSAKPKEINQIRRIAGL